MIALLSLASTCYAFDSNPRSTVKPCQSSDNRQARLWRPLEDRLDREGRGAREAIKFVGASKAHKKAKTDKGYKDYKATKKEAK